MLALILSLLDIVAGIVIFIRFDGLIATILALILLIKGVTSVLGSAAARYWLDWMGWIDIIAAATLFFTWPAWLSLLLVIKGLYSLIRSVVG